MEEIILEAEVRDELGKGKVKGLRDDGFIPAVVYSQGKEPVSVKLSHKKFLGLVHQYQQRLESTVINLKIANDKSKGQRACLVKEIQYDPVKGDVTHVDFNQISLTKVIKVNVPVNIKGESIGVKQEGGSLEHVLWEIEVECLPTDIPKGIDIDITSLKIGGSIHVKDVTFPANVKPLTDPGAIIVSIAEPMKEEAPAEAVEGEEKKEPEVIKEKKEVPAEGEGKEEKK